MNDLQTKTLPFILKTSFLYGLLAVIFSVFSIFFPPTVTQIVGNPLEVSGISIEHVVGHIIWGLMIGIFTLKLRYFAISGLFPIILDADHLIQFFDIEMISRMAHSIPFGLFAAVSLMAVFGRRDYMLGGIAFASVFTHISYDILLGGTTSFPIFAPFIADSFTFQNIDWVLIQIVAIAVIVGILFLTKKETRRITI